MFHLLKKGGLNSQEYSLTRYHVKIQHKPRNKKDDNFDTLNAKMNLSIQNLFCDCESYGSTSSP